MRKLMVASLAALGLLLSVAAAPAPAVEIGRDGCTPGYWKNHTDNWQEADPAKPVSNKFAVTSQLDGVTQLEALSLPGGPGVAGAERILIRAAMAAYLNAAHEGLGYPWRRTSEGLDGRPPLVPTVDAAIASGDRQTMLDLATWLDNDNNGGTCPLN